VTWVQRRYRPYRWGNRLAVGVVAGQLIGMLHSPLVFPVTMPAALESAVASFIARGGDAGERSADVEVAIGRAGDGVPVAVNAADFEGGIGRHGDGRAGEDRVPARPPSGDPSAGPGPSSTTSPSSTGRPGPGTTTGPANGPEDTAGPITTGRPPAGPASTGAPTTSSSTPQSGPPGTTGPSTSTTDPGDDPLEPVTSADPCALPPDATAEWMVTLEAGDEETMHSRLAVVATAAGVPIEQFSPAGPVTWRVAAAAGGMCSTSKLVEVVSVDRLS
jgi:hypothetical protein